MVTEGEVMAGLVNRRASFILGVRTGESEFEHSYPHNGARGSVLSLGVSRAATTCQPYAFCSEQIAKCAPDASEFLAVTDLAWQAGNGRHQFCEQHAA